MTATAKEEKRRAILTTLAMHSAVVIKRLRDRENIFYGICKHTPLENIADQLVRGLKKYNPLHAVAPITTLEHPPMSP